MERSLPVIPLIQPVRTCVWSDAGVIGFRLCDRAFECERCMLDAALRGDPRLTLGDSPGPPGHPHAPWSFPTDRLYSPGHMWVQVIPSGHARAGIDACAAWLFPPILTAKAPSGDLVDRGDPLCVLGFPAGELSPPSPICGSLHAWNDRLAADPGLLASDPYGAGWIAEIVPAGSIELDKLEHAEDAARNARLTARHLGRQTALGLLSAVEPVWIDPGLLEATQRALGPCSYLQIVRDCLR